MQSSIVCECGNRVEIPENMTGIKFRACPRCGRKVFIDETEAAADYDSAFDVGHKKPPDKEMVVFDTTSVPNAADPESTQIQSSVAAFADSSLFALSGAQIGEKSAGSHIRCPLPEPAGSVPKLPSAADNNPPQEMPNRESSSIVQGMPVAETGTRTAELDLTKRVMRAITKPVLPVIPYSGKSEYGIHKIIRVHQKGGMGRILIAYDSYLKREVAIKELHLEVAEDESIVKRFVGEAEITAQLEHPGIIPVHRLGIYRTDEGQELPYYTMKYVKGDTLQDIIKNYHQHPSREKLKYLIRRLISVSKTMAFAHSKGVIHRDLKPANVMVGEHEETLVMDWGLAKPLNQSGEDSYVSIIHSTRQSRPELTMVGAIVGTPAFMSPEQANADDHVVGPLSDIFSLGAVLYYLLTGQTPFSGRSTQEVLAKVREAVVVPPSSIKSNVPHELEAVCLKAMAKLPHNRYQGAAELAEDLCCWLDGKPISAEKDTVKGKFYRWLRQHRSISTALSVILTAILTATLCCFIMAKPAENKPAEMKPLKNSVPVKSS
ncbi:MAG: serine/threonine protein kinase [Planctomycetaceae bacterium]|jgi:serine/threonine protein kinase/DNA-directed RNA polymerase subunit RPC12/RpoP|nr:serine/threonine protein kinase [Planctomycetaceae bacterium]